MSSAIYSKLKKINEDFRPAAHKPAAKIFVAMESNCKWRDVVSCVLG
jgi:hypothetical protein